ncbi:phloem protein 2-like protein [Tanacetum coccineum]
MDLHFTADGNLRELSGEEAWEAIENFAQGQKEWDNPPNIISKQEVANLKAQAKRLFRNEDVWVEMHREVEETLGTPKEVEPLNETQLEDLGLNTCNHDIPLSSREVPNYDEPEPQPNPLPNYPFLDISLGEERGPEPPIKPHSPDSFRIKEVDSLTINISPSPHVTMDLKFMETVWWVFAELYKKGLVYKGFKWIPKLQHFAPGVPVVLAGTKLVDKVFYCEDPKNKGWSVARHIKLKDVFDLGSATAQGIDQDQSDGTFNVSHLHRIGDDGDDGKDVTSDTEHDGTDDEEDEFCLDAARGLNFLHNGNGKNDTIIHGDIKSSNILISREGVGMIGDFGLSTNQDTHRLTKEYDVFSFGVVLFEVMSGRLTDFKITKDDPELLPMLQRKLNNIIDPIAEIFHVDVRKYVGKKESLVELYGYPRRLGKVALKRREIMSNQGIDVLSGLNHQNIVPFVGFCYEADKMIIIYDYASNGSFETYLRNNQNLKWEQLLQICIDTSQGLNYLHNHHIIHRDVKSGNILLGGSCKGIIGDIGLSKTIGEGDFQLIVDTAGTSGYVDPKYFKGILTKQSDMYSFGVVLLEVFLRRKEFSELF